MAAVAAGGVAHRGASSNSPSSSRRSRTQFEEWVSHGRIPTDAGTHRAPVASLEDLVDVTIDCDRRVGYDRSRELHAVLDGGVVYYYGTVPEWAASESGFQFLPGDELKP